MREPKTGAFYFVRDVYFCDFPDPYLMRNKELLDGQKHGRPCFFAFRDEETGVLWMIPISSRVQKYHKLVDKKKQKYGKCETIKFGNVLGRERAFLIQNICPMSDMYIGEQYIDTTSGTPVRLEESFEKMLIKEAKQVLARVRKGIKIVFPDVLAIEKP